MASIATITFTDGTSERAKTCPIGDGLFLYDLGGGRAIVSQIAPNNVEDYVLLVAGEQAVNEDFVEAEFVKGTWSIGKFFSKDVEVVPKENGDAKHMNWPSIGHLNNVSKYLETSPHDKITEIVYRAKVKLHGTNSAIQVRSDGNVFAQSRSRLITPKSDNNGFAKWVKQHEESFRQLSPCIIYGEWCGKGVQKGDAICEIKTKQFCVFTVAIPFNESAPFTGNTDVDVQTVTKIMYEPDEISQFLEPAINAIDTAHVLPWIGDSFRFTFNVEGDTDVNTESLAQLNALVNDIGREDPWVKSTFGVSGSGEGIVLTPVRYDSFSKLQFLHEYAAFAFKAKVDAHAVKAQKKPAQMETEVAGDVTKFVDMFVTEPRLRQAIGEVGEDIGKVIGWMMKDIKKESTAELAESGLKWKDVTKPITTKVRGEMLKMRGQP